MRFVGECKRDKLGALVDKMWVRSVVVNANSAASAARRLLPKFASALPLNKKFI